MVQKLLEKTGRITRRLLSSRVSCRFFSNESQARRVYVGNLSWGVKWQDLKDHMREVGKVTRADIISSADGRSKGCGIVEYANEEDAKKAVSKLNDTDLKGRLIYVREDREEREFSGRGFSTDDAAQRRRVYVSNLSWDVEWQVLKDHMRGAGKVSHVEVLTEANGWSKGCGIVEYGTPEEAQEAISTLNNTELKGCMISVREDRKTNSAGGNSVYIWNLTNDTSWQEVKDHCKIVGNVDHVNVFKDSDGKSKGCGVVIFQHPKEAERAIDELQSSLLNGQPVYLREDYNPKKWTSRKYGRKVFVRNLNFETTWQELKNVFREVGEVEYVNVMQGSGTIRFSNAEEAHKAIEQLNGVELHGCKLEISIDGDSSFPDLI